MVSDVSDVCSCTDARVSMCFCLCVGASTCHYSRYVRPMYSTCVHVCMTPPVAVHVGGCTGCLGARGAGGALQGRLGEASGEGSDAGVCQGGGREQLVPAADCGRQVQVL